MTNYNNHDVILSMRVQAFTNLAAAKAKVEALESQVKHLDHMLEIKEASAKARAENEAQEAKETKAPAKEKAPVKEKAAKTPAKEKAPVKEDKPLLPGDEMEEEKTVSLEDVQNALRGAMSKAGGGDEGKKYARIFLEKFGVKKAADLKPEQYELLVDAINSASDDSETQEDDDEL